MYDWVELEEFPGYSINEKGLVKNNRTNRVLTRKYVGLKSPFVGLMVNGKQIQRQINRLMLASYPTETWPEFFDTPIHLDGNKDNCRLENLRLRPRWFAVKYHKDCREDLFPQWDRDIYIEELDRTFESPWQIAREFGVLQLAVYRSLLTEEELFPYDWHLKI